MAKLANQSRAPEGRAWLYTVTRWALAKALIAGISVLILTQVLYIGVLVKINYYELLRWVLLVSPCLAAFSTAYLAPRQKVIWGISMSVFGVVIGMLSAIGYEYFGLTVDHIGGPVATFVILMAYHAPLSIVGSVAGYFLSKKRAP